MLLLSLVILLAAWEWAGLSGFTGLAWRLVYTLLVPLVLIVVGFLSGFYELGGATADLVNPLHIITAGGLWWLLALWCVITYPASTRWWGRGGLQLVIGLLVLLPAFLAAFVLLQLGQGRYFLLFVVLIVACADIGAFFVGRRFGRRSLAPQVSPGKTVEGLLGGLVAVILMAVGAFWFFSMYPQQGIDGVLGGDQWRWLLVVLLCSLASVLGDLNESMVKRHRGVKDSGTILPGHGGVLDRIDSLSASLPVFVLGIWFFDLVELSAQI